MNKESKIEYVPFERKVIDYEERQRVETVPKKRIITEYEERIKEELVPRVITKHDYYAVEYIKEYVAEQIPEKSVRMVERKVPYKRIEYVPVTRYSLYYVDKLYTTTATITNKDSRWLEEVLRDIP